VHRRQHLAHLIARMGSVDLPAELATVADAWARLSYSYSHQRRIAEGIESARKPETRAARVQKALAELGG
jgi:uncharacterized protein YdeI (YjbR/CyaY-like superfamily)